MTIEDMGGVGRETKGAGSGETKIGQEKGEQRI